MVQISLETWEEILSNQSLALIGTKEPGNGNGYHDRISWRIPFRPKKEQDEFLYSSTFYSIYLRDLGHSMNPSYSSSNKFEEGLNIINCSENYYNTLLKYLVNDSYPSRNELLRRLGEWGENFCYCGRLIFEFISWYDNESSQFYGFELNRLDLDYCIISKDSIIYNAPYELEGDKELFKKVIIPKSKCIIIDFPKELGGYKGFRTKVEEIKKLGSKYNISEQPGSNLEQMKNWDKQFARIVSDWGASNKIENVTEFYQAISALKFNYTAVSCLHEIINGLNQVIVCLNTQLKENASVELDIQYFNLDYLKIIESKWMDGELGFKELNQILKEIKE